MTQLAGIQAKYDTLDFAGKTQKINLVFYNYNREKLAGVQMENKNKDKGDKKKKKKIRKDLKRRRKLTKAKIVDDLADVRAHQLLQTLNSSTFPATGKSKGSKTVEENPTRRKVSGPRQLSTSTFQPSDKTALNKPLKQDECEDISGYGRSSMKQIVHSQKEDEQMENKRLESALEAMRLMKKAQKEFTWDIVTPPKKEVKMKG